MTKMQMWPVIPPDLYLPHPCLAGVWFFSIASSGHVSRGRPFSWPSVPAEKAVLLDASMKLPLPDRKRLFFSNMLCQTHGFHLLELPAVY